MDKKSQFLYQFRAYFVNSNSIPIPFFSIPIPSPIPGIESGIEFNSHSIPELTPTLVRTGNKTFLQLNPNYMITTEDGYILKSQMNSVFP